MGIIQQMASNPNTDWAFLSFSFDGKNIQDFGLVATLSGDRYSKNLTGPFANTFQTIPSRVGDVFGV